jgi:hypothetical protein
MSISRYFTAAMGTLVLTAAAFIGNAYGQQLNGARTPSPTPSTRRPFQKTIHLTIPEGSSFGESEIAIPAGKQLVIENVSARSKGRVTPSMSFTTWYDDNGNGLADAGDESVHDVTFTLQNERYEAPSLFTWTANHRVLVFAAERIGETHFGVKMAVQTSYPVIEGNADLRLVLSGYLEDLPQ